MTTKKTRFFEFVVDGDSEQLTGGGKPIKLRPKTFALLCELMQSPGKMLSKDHLISQVWPDTAVTEWVLSSCIKELRQALGDDPRQPRFIETVHRRGFRFIAPLRIEPSAAAPTPPEESFRPAERPALVGRSNELGRLQQWWEDASRGRRQIVFVIGEPGIGKTSLVDSFVRPFESHGPNPTIPEVLVAHGQCVDQHGTGEPYLPLIEAIGRLCRGRHGEEMIGLLRRHAPAWLAQLPGLLDPEEFEILERRIAAGTRDRMLRDLASFTEALPRPLILILEDLQWSDPATIEVISMLARRRDPVRLLLIGTYRPVETTLRDHPLRGTHLDLLTRDLCRDLWLQPLTAESVDEYVNGRFPGLDQHAEIAATLFERTDGNPLFLVNVTDSIRRDGLITRRGDHWSFEGAITDIETTIPAGLRQMLAAQIDRLEPSDRTILEAASLAGRGFSAALVAAVLETDVLDVENCLNRLAQRGQLVGRDGESSWPDGTVAGEYRFSHALYQSVLGEHVPPGQRRLIHGRIADRLQTAFGSRVGEIAAIVAFHFEASGQPMRAIRHLMTAAELAIRHGGGQEAIEFLRRGLNLTEAAPLSAARNGSIVELSLRLARALPTVYGFSHPDIETSYQRAIQLSEEGKDPIGHFQAVAGQMVHLVARARLPEATRMIPLLTRLMEDMPNPAFDLGGNLILGQLRCHTGPLARARAHLELGLSAPDVPLPTTSIDLRVASLTYLAVTLAHLGFPDQSRARLAEAEARAESGRPFDRGSVAQGGCYIAFQLRDMAFLNRNAEIAMSLGNDHGFPVIRAIGSAARGRALVESGEVSKGIDLIRHAISDYQESGSALSLPMLIDALIEAHLAANELESAAREIAHARQLIAESGDERYIAELHRLEGEIHLAEGRIDEAATCFQRAVDDAQAQGGGWWELRAWTSLSSLALRPGQQTDVSPSIRERLAETMNKFSEGHDTVDWMEACSVLGRLT